MITFHVKKLLDNGFRAPGYKLVPPEVKGHGHLATNIAFVIAKKQKIAPLHAAEIVKEFLTHAAPRDFFEKIEIAAPGFVNFTFTAGAIQSEFSRIAKAKDWGKTAIGGGKRVIVEYSSPNIAKPMHVGHFRSTIIGDALANIHEFLGYKVIRWNYLGDWGTQFGKVIAAWKLWGDETLLKKDPIYHLLDLYVRFSAEAKEKPELEKRGQEEFKKLEEGDEDNRKLWRKFRAESVKGLNALYKKLGVRFDIYIGESFYERDLRKIIDYLLSREIAVKSEEGGVIVPLDDFNLPPALIQKSDGASLYITRDIANILYRVKKYNPTKIIYEIGGEQSLHFQQLFAMVKADFLPGLKGAKNIELTHVGHGLVLGEDGKKLSTREGKTIFMDDLVEEALQKTRRIIEEKDKEREKRFTMKEKETIATAVAIGALKYNDLSQNRLSNISFDWDKMLSFEGDSAPYLLYSYARLKSIARRAVNLKFKISNFKYLGSELELGIILKLDRFPEVIGKIAIDYYPNELASYLYDLAKSINHFYQSEPVLKAEKGAREARLALIESVSKVLKTGLNLLGIETLENM